MLRIGVSRSVSLFTELCFAGLWTATAFSERRKIVSTVQIYVLQTPHILLDGEQIILPYKKAEALLYYMAIEKKATRDQIAALLWDSCDEATAKKNLRPVHHP